MILLNFSHPLTHEQIQQVEALTGQPIDRLIDIPTQIDPQQPLIPQIVALIDAAGLSPVEWQTLPLLVNPPSRLYRRGPAGRAPWPLWLLSPPNLRLRPVQGSLPPRYEVANGTNPSQWVWDAWVIHAQSHPHHHLHHPSRRDIPA